MEAKYYLLSICAALIIVFIFSSIKTYLDKKRITNYYSDKKYTICDISKDALIFGFFNRDSEDFYHVVLKSKSGDYILRSCKTDIISGVKEFSTHNKKLCKHCLSVLDTYYIECPKCNKKI